MCIHTVHVAQNRCGHNRTLTTRAIDRQINMAI